jgi:hypothetical protein
MPRSLTLPVELGVMFSNRPTSWEPDDLYPPTHSDILHFLLVPFILEAELKYRPYNMINTTVFSSREAKQNISFFQVATCVLLQLVVNIKKCFFPGIGRIKSFKPLKVFIHPHFS